MTDSNRPAYFEIIDTDTCSVIDVRSSASAAMAVCEELEPGGIQPFQNYRFIIDPVRPTPVVSPVSNSPASNP